MVLIDRTNVIGGATNDSFRVPGVSGGSGLLTADVVLSRADVQALDDTPIELLPAVAGNKYVVLGVYASKAAGAYAGGAAVTINYTDSGDTLVATIAVAHFRASGTDTRWASNPGLSGLPSAHAIPTDSVDCSTGTEFTGDGGDVTLTVLYLEIAD